jgi:predicted acyl esterase
VTAAPEEVGSVQTVSVDLVTLQQFFEAGETLRLTVAGADAGFNVSRQAAGALVEHASTLSLPVRDA